MSKRILIVGGVAGGASFAARMRRLDEEAEIIMYEKGDYISFANCGLPYHIGNIIKERENLIVQTPEAFKKRFNIDVKIKTEVTAVDPSKKEVTIKNSDGESKEKFDYLVLSPGATPFKPPIDGIKTKGIFTLRNIPDMDRIIEKIEKSKVKKAVVIGGGFIGIETAENLRHRDIDVSLVELVDQIFMPADWEMANILHQHVALNGIKLYLSNGAQSFSENKYGGIDIKLSSGEVLSADIVILAIGVKPDTLFLKDSGIELTERGYIKANENLQTNFEYIYAIGDAIEVTDLVSEKSMPIPLAGPANKQGRIVADNINGKNVKYNGTQGTAICKIFDLTAAVTGLNEKNAKKFDIEYMKTYLHGASHAGYYPNSYPMSIKVLFTPDNGRILGAQIIGTDGVDKRIDILATAVRHKMTVYDLKELELAYAPPYGSAKDPVNMIGFIGENILEDKCSVVYPESIEGMDKSKTELLDIRTDEEFEMGYIEGAIHIPLDDLRNNLDKLDKTKKYWVYCQVGLRGYVGCRILSQYGFKTKNLSGGYKTYLHLTEKIDDTVYYTSELNEATCSAPEGLDNSSNITIVDACGLQCPGPIMKLKKALETENDGAIIEVQTTDSGFVKDVPAWCSNTGNELISLNRDGGIYKATIKKGSSATSCLTADPAASPATKHKTMVVFSNHFDKLMATFIIANGAASMGSEITLFFTFWAVNVLRKGEKINVKKSITEKMFDLMMPRGSKKVKLSKMNMGGMGKKMMLAEMKKKNIYTLEDLLNQAKENGVKLVACKMSMDIMGIKEEELIDGVEIGGVAYYLNEADKGNFNLFI